MKTDFRCIFALVIVVVCFLSCSSARAETGWKTRSGQIVTGELVAFDFEQKIATVKSEAAGQAQVPTSDLDYAARKKILFSNVFHQSFPEKFSKEQSSMLLLCLFVPSILFLVGFWLAGLVFTKRWSPFKAILGFFGGWIVAVILIFCYFKFAAQSPGNVKALLTAGGLVSVLAVSVFVSAIYRCKILVGFYIFISHFFFAILVAVGLNYWMHKKAEPEWIDTNSEDYVFRPVGIVGEKISPPETE